MESNQEVPRPQTRLYNEEISSVQILDSDIAENLKKLKPGKSTEPYGVHQRVLKEASDSLAKPLGIIFRKSLHTGTLPTQWKQVHITAI